MIGIITLQNFMYFNYGGVLQNFALYYYLKKMGYSVEAIHCDANTFNNMCRLEIYKKFKVKVVRQNKKLKFIKTNNLVRKRDENFKKFIKTNMDCKNYPWYSQVTYNKISKRYRAVVIGSDQVWHPQFALNEISMDTFLLSFLPAEKRISYAASFGVSELPDKIKSKVSQELSRYHAISVREEAGAEIVKKLTQREVPVVIDPTMLLSAEEWREVAKPLKNEIKKPYILKYFLGEQSNEQREEIVRISNKYDLEILELANKNCPEEYISGPAEFLNLFDNATLIYTDSFHATVFSILFGKPFVVYNRTEKNVENMESRIHTLLKKLGLESRLPNCVKEENLFFCDYDVAYSNLELERIKAKNYINESLNR